LLPRSSEPQTLWAFSWQNRIFITAGLLLIAASLLALVWDARRTLALGDPDKVVETGGIASSQPAPREDPVALLDEGTDNGKGMRAALVEQAQMEAGEGSPAQSGGAVPTRIVIPIIHLDAVVVPADSRLIKYEGKYYSQWVAPNTFAAGWHTYSAPLGVTGNTVLNGHHNEYGEVFRHLVDLKIGDEILVYSGDLAFGYEVVAKKILPERGQPTEVRLANAAWIMPTPDERLTLVTCWPYESNSHRLIVVARPAANGESAAGADLP